MAGHVLLHAVAFGHAIVDAGSLHVVSMWDATEGDLSLPPIREALALRVHEHED